MTESQLIKSIKDYLTLKNILFIRNSSGSMPVGEGSNKRYITFGAKGSPDIICWKNNKSYGFECKVGKNRMSLEQHAWQQRFENEGGVYVLARTLDDVQKLL